MDVSELKQWLNKVEEEGAKELKVDMDCAFGSVWLNAMSKDKSPTSIIDSIMLTQ